MTNDFPTQLLPAQFMRVISGEAKTDIKDILVQYVASEPGTIELTQKQQEQLERAVEADRLMRTRRYSRRQMELILAGKFKYSIDTARKDLLLAEHIWGRAVKRNKSYLISNHIDDIDDAIRAAREAGDQKHLAIFMDLKTKALKELSDETASDTTPAAIIMNFTLNQAPALTDNPLNATEARTIAAKYMGKDIEDIEEL